MRGLVLSVYMFFVSVLVLTGPAGAGECQTFSSASSGAGVKQVAEEILAPGKVVDSTKPSGNKNLALETRKMPLSGPKSFSRN